MLSHRLHAVSTVLRRCWSSHQTWLRISPAVQEALDQDAPVLALETALVTHGLPYPHNLDTALAVESLVRAEGVVPATVAMIRGRMCIGLTRDELASLARHPTPAKVSRRDIARLLTCPHTLGGTTVSATMVGAHAAGIKVFATGGIGGVHRGGEITWDVSADLAELGRTPICVVCAGAKSILDIPRTLEVLETHGVCVVAMGTDFFPAFYQPSSGHRAPGRVESEEAAALMVDALGRAEMGSGMLVAVPIPWEAAGSGAAVEAAIEAATREADKKGVRGREVTPFVLERVHDLTSGDSLRANIALMKHNAGVGARIALELSRVRNSRESSKTAAEATPVLDAAKEMVVAGGSNVDFVCTATSAANIDDLKALAASHPGDLTQSPGGVGRNIAETLARLGATHHLLTALGDDPAARFLRRAAPNINLDRALVLPDRRTAQYTALLNAEGELMFGLGDMDIHAAIDAQYLRQNADIFTRARIVALDANLPTESLKVAAELCKENGAPLWFDPTDVLKANKMFEALGSEGSIDFASPNAAEFERMYKHVVGADLNLEAKLNACVNVGLWRDLLRELLLACEALQPRVSNLLVKLGIHGAFYWSSEAGASEAGLWCSSKEIDEKLIVSVSGSGDSLVGAFMVARWMNHWPAEMCLHMGMKAAHASLMTRGAVNPELNPRHYTADDIEQWAKDNLKYEWL